MTPFINQKIRLHQLATQQGDPVANKEEILRQLACAQKEGVQLAIFPEWAITGLLGVPEWRHAAFRDCCEACLQEIVAATENIALLLGTVCSYHGEVVAAVVAAENKKQLTPQHSPLPFVPKLRSRTARFDGFTDTLYAADIASMEHVPLQQLFAPFNFQMGCVGAWCGKTCMPSPEELVQQGARLLVHLDTKPYTRDVPPDTEAASLSTDCGVPLLQCGSCGVADTGKTLFVLEGNSAIYYPNGTCSQLPLFHPGQLNFSEPTSPHPLSATEYTATATVIQALESGCRQQLARLHLSRIVVGASGGIDSALTAALYSRIIGPDNLLLVNMPSRHNSQTTIGLARQLAINLGCHYTEIPIEPSVALTRSQITDLICERPATSNEARLTLSLSDSAFENVQARDRSTRVLAALSSAFGGVFTCNANKSESTIGYGTLYGDITGFFAALADLWKYEIWELARFYNRSIFRQEVIPQGSIEIVPSAELSPEQNVDEGKGDPLIYAWHDRLFAAWTERDHPLTPEAMLKSYAAEKLAAEIGYAGNSHDLFPEPIDFYRDLTQMWSLYRGLAQAKRLQAPPVLSLKHRTFGFDLGTAQLPVFLSPEYRPLLKEPAHTPSHP